VRYKKRAIQLLILVPLLLAVYLIDSVIRHGEYIAVSGFAQGTTYHITYESRKGEDLQAQIEDILHKIDQSLSIYQPNSLISKINKNDTRVRADQAFTDVFKKSAEVFKKTGGAFDITVGPIVNALGFGSADTLNINSSLIDSLRQFVGMQKVRLNGNIVEKDDSRILLDVNAIAQGYSVDVVARFLEEKKIRNYLVEIGGEVRAKGRNNERQVWRIGIDKPVEGNMVPGANLQAVVELKNKSLATSGNYRKYYEKNGVKYVHTIDPQTGYPVISNLLSATVIADDCTTADAYATALMVFGVQNSIAFLNDNTFLNAYLIYTDDNGNFQVYATPGLSEFIEQ
jgi:FAD:protein FMN transferase